MREDALIFSTGFRLIAPMDLCPWGTSVTHKKPVRVRLLSLPNIKRGSLVRCWIVLISINEVPHVDHEKLSGDRIRKTSASIRAQVQAERNIQRKQFSNNGSSDIVGNADVGVGEIRQFCRLQDEG